MPKHTFIFVEAAIIEYHRLSGSNNRNCFLTVLGDISPRSRCGKTRFYLRLFFLACRRPSSRQVPSWLFLCACTDLVSFPLLLRTLALLDQGFTLLFSFNLNYLSKTSLFKWSHWKLRLQHIIFKEYNSLNSNSICMQKFISEIGLHIVMDWQLFFPFSVIHKNMFLLRVELILDSGNMLRQ